MGVRVVAVDIGSAGQSSKFARAAFDAPGRDLIADGTDPETAVPELVPGLLAGAQAALLLEAPMSVPVPDGQPGAWRRLGRARKGEGNRPWSAGAGAASLATGLAQGAWMLRQLAISVPGLAATTQPRSWQRGGAQLLLAEAFITAAGKPMHCQLITYGWPCPPTWPGSRAPPVSTPNPTCAATCDGALTAAWTRWPRAARTWSSTSGGCKRPAGSSPPPSHAGSRSPPGSTAPASSTACSSTPRPIMSAGRMCRPDRPPSDSRTCSSKRC